jgi:hypothetical protein
VQNPIDVLADHPTLLVVAGGVGSSLCGLGLRQAWGHWTAIGWTIGIAVCVALPTLGTSRNKLQQGKRAARDAIRKVLMACATSYAHPGGNVRVNIMVLSRNRQRRHVDSETAFNMHGDPDSDLEIDATAGVSGEAFVHRKPAYGDLLIGLNPGGPSWGLRESEKAKVRSDLKSILSVPLFDPDDPDGQLLGTLQIDSNVSLQEMGFDQPDHRQIAERFADVVALLLKTGR